MLRQISLGKKPKGESRRPTPTATALAGYLLTAEAGTLTLREAAAVIDRDVRSCRAAVDSLIGYGIEGLAWADSEKSAFVYQTEAGSKNCDPAPESIVLDEGQEPVEAPAIIAQEVAFDIPDAGEFVEYIPETLAAVETDQLSLFGGFYEPMPVYSDYEPFTVAASRVREQKKELEPMESDGNRCDVPAIPSYSQTLPRTPIVEQPANLVQTLCKPCADIVQGVQKAGHGALAAAMERLAATLDGKPGNISAHTPAPAPTCARATKEKQENINNQSTNVNQEALNHEFKLLIAHPKIVPRFDAAERERRIAEIREKVPDAAEHVVGTLANMMAFGTMPESVFYGALRDASAPTVRNRGAFLNAKVQRLKKEYRWCS